MCAEMKAHDLKRLETMKSVLRSYAEARRNLVAKALQNAEELCAMIERIEPTLDSEGDVLPQFNLKLKLHST